MEIEEIKAALEKKVIELNDQTNKLDLIYECFKNYYAKDTRYLVKKCEISIKDLCNDDDYSDAVDQVRVQKHIDELTAAVDNLHVELNDLEVIKKNLTLSTKVEAYDEISKYIVELIDKDLDLGNISLERANNAFNGDFEKIDRAYSIEDKSNKKADKKLKDIKEELEAKEDEANKVVGVEDAPAEVVTDSISDLAKEYEDEFNKEDEEENKDSLESILSDDSFKFDPIEDTKEEEEEKAILEPEDEVDLSEVVEENSLDVKAEDEVETAKSVEEGWVKVDLSLTEDFAKDVEEENKIEDIEEAKGRKRAA